VPRLGQAEQSLVASCGVIRALHAPQNATLPREAPRPLQEQEPVSESMITS